MPQLNVEKKIRKKKNQFLFPGFQKLNIEKLAREEREKEEEEALRRNTGEKMGFNGKRKHSGREGRGRESCRVVKGS